MTTHESKSKASSGIVLTRGVLSIMAAEAACFVGDLFFFSFSAV